MAPINYEPSGEPVLYQTDAYEFASETGYKTFEAMDVSGGSLFLTTQAPYSWEGESSNTAAGNKDIDFTVDRPLKLNGTAIINFTAAVTRVSGGSLGVESVFTVKLIHYDGTTETVLGTGNYQLGATLNDGEGRNKILSFKFASVDQFFKATDIIRINVAWTLSGGAGVNAMKFYHDPKNRTYTMYTATTTTTSKFEVYLPIDTKYS